MSQENSNMSAPSRLDGEHSENAGFIDWYDSPRVLPTQSKRLRRGTQLLKTRSAEEFSPRSYLDETASTSDLDSFWCIESPSEHITPLAHTETSALDIFEKTHSTSDQTTPHRTLRSAKLLSRKRHRKPDNQLKIEESENVDEKRMSMEEGLAVGMASLAKLRQRLRSEGDTDKLKTDADVKVLQRTPLRPKSSPASSPIVPRNALKRKSDTLLTPSLTRPSQRFVTSTPKHDGVAATPLKRFRTMNDTPCKPDSTREKILRTQSMNDTKEDSDDDSFLTDVFVPFKHPSQFFEMLKHNPTQKS
ncbi:unnamed protein product [Cylicocyclus nassatus]|uniref:Uncharacterized protein n=1 Tax=Cylicocyclus nassatus TaxID=53992 RepID=A0AA36GEG9_CYLNA|nr:unnamed protein product [Cylicocyclus nassatus]